MVLREKIHYCQGQQMRLLICRFLVIYFIISLVVIFIRLNNYHSPAVYDAFPQDHITSQVIEASFRKSKRSGKELIMPRSELTTPSSELVTPTAQSIKARTFLTTPRTVLTTPSSESANARTELTTPSSDLASLELFEKRELNEKYLFNESCQIDYLGLLDYLSGYCQKNDSLVSCQRFTCRNILSGRLTNDKFEKLQQIMAANPKPQITDAQLSDLTANCSDFLRKFGYEEKLREGYLNADDANFSIAYNLIVHRNAAQIERLLHTLYLPQNQFCIHVDLKSTGDFKSAMFGLASCLSNNVFIATKREMVIYTGFSRLQADINCMDDHVRRGMQWRYLINTAGEAFPLRSQREMIEILKAYDNHNDIEGVANPTMAREYTEGEFREVKRARRMIRTGKKNPAPPHNITMIKGSAYGTFTRQFVEFLLKDKRSLDLLNWLKLTYSPDELYWATLNNRFSNPQINAPGGYDGKPGTDRWLSVYVNWNETTCQGRVSRFICVHGVRDLKDLLFRKELFVNKFHSDFEPVAQDCLKAWIDHKDHCPVYFDKSFYKK